MKNNSALFYTCSLIEFIGRRQKLRRSELVTLMGSSAIGRIYRYADVFHCEPIAKTADDFVTMLNIPEGSFDNVVGLPLTQLELALKREFSLSLFDFEAVGKRF